MPNLFMIDLEGTEVSEIEKKILQHKNVGAIILFTRNFTNPEQLKKLIEDVRSIRPDIFIAVDHEGGIVQRFQRHGFRSLPAARVYGDVYNLNPVAGIKLALQYGEIMANDLLAYGIDLSLAPVLDIHGVNSVIAKLDRAFHSDPNVIIKLAEAFIQGMKVAGMPSVSKHFPGHGSCSFDSHVVKPTYDASENQLRDNDLKPFVNLIQKKLLAAVMPAHVTYTAIDSENPAGFSKVWLQKILREELDFQGIILSDCLGMAGADIGDMKTRSERALEAGCDMLIVCHQTREALFNVLETVSFNQSNESSKRLDIFKQQMVHFKNLNLHKETLKTFLPFMLSSNLNSATSSLNQNPNKEIIKTEEKPKVSSSESFNKTVSI